MSPLVVREADSDGGETSSKARPRAVGGLGAYLPHPEARPRAVGGLGAYSPHPDASAAFGLPPFCPELAHRRDRPPRTTSTLLWRAGARRNPRTADAKRSRADAGGLSPASGAVARGLSPTR